MNRDKAAGLFKKLQVMPRHSTSVVTGLVHLDGRAAVLLSFPNGNYEMSERVELRFMRSLKLDADEYQALRDCRISRSGYLEILRHRSSR